MAGMVRRNRKIVNYSEFGDFEDGDEDFACIGAPLTKKSRTQPKEPKKETKKKQKPRKESTPLQKESPIGKTSLDDSFCERDLNVTLALSIKEKSANIHEVQNSEEQGLSQVLDDDIPMNGCRQRTAAFKAFSHQKLLTIDSCDREHVTDSEPVTVPDEESEKDSDYSEGNDEDCAMEKMNIKGNKKEIKRQTGKEKTPKSENNTTVMKVKSEQTQKKMSTSSEPVGRPLHTSSPVTNKKPKWVPPAATGTSNNSTKYASVKSPTQCLRLGLSRLARVKPLHPNATSR
ncbi:RAD51-associated protein 1 isoform X1 [Tympanuchus pallidicinctus]|uniref:RAD51-associated protein 1 isoform X1 n=1 Tax=Tympanuchus pallidicinctus TaxID=109042 RepID=UPI0022874521|nr:RAD51-associated protein 1 isoform X1 [Tympanuchus pallidicinctus]